MSVRQDEMVFNMAASYLDKVFNLADRAITAQVELTKALAAEGGCSEQFLELRSVEAREAREVLAQFGSELKELGLAAERCYSGTLEHKLEMRRLELDLELKKFELSHELELRKLESDLEMRKLELEQPTAYNVRTAKIENGVNHA